MAELTNKERLIELKGLIVNLDSNFTEFKDDSKEDDIRKWKQINKNAQSIAGMRGMSVAIAFVATILTNLGVYFGFKH
jgi:hypothetical protein